jgi:hypothetical protein
VTMPTEDILSRIGKLLALASNHAATPDEAATAMAMAQKLLETHNLSMDQVEQAHGRKTKESEVARGKTQVGKWEVDLYVAIAQANYCKVLRQRRYDLYLIGRPVNMQAAQAMFAWIRDQAERLWREEWDNDPRHEYMNWRTHKAGFYRGFTTRIWRRLSEQAEAAPKVAVTMALARRDENQDYVERNFGPMRRGYQESRSYDQHAVGRGYTRGGDASLRKQGEIGGDKRELSGG